MSNANRPKVPLSAETYERRECILEAFEDAWRRGERPNLTDYLPATGPDRLPLLVELAHEELDHRIKAGESGAWRTTCAAIPTWRETPTRSSASSPPSGNCAGNERRERRRSISNASRRTAKSCWCGCPSRPLRNCRRVAASIQGKPDGG